ncbi:MAG: aminotransferase class I/II-fold pyridoxal phosphate-dependent enzyme [Acidothermales bacterium]|nr:aminotransferase class I/II-fold pyridoxal phosphate-dependent enzyme [Acidothermales bacterium]
MRLDHTQAPVLEAVADYHRRGELPFTPPGHKQARGADPRARAVLGDAVYTTDMLAISGMDDRTSSAKVLDRAEELMADAVGAEHTFFTTCGSSLSVKSAMLAVAGPHEKLIVGRDAHKSVISGLVLSGIDPVWVSPSWDADLHLAHPPSPAAFAQAFERDPDARGALVVSPTPYGTCADLAAIAKVCHRYGAPLIVDEAWGAHLPFHPDLPAWAMNAGADVCVTSVHKMGAGLEQGSVFHQQGELVDPTVLRSRADLLGTTSPSVPIYAGMDAWRRQMVESGRELLQAAIDRAFRVRDAIEAIPGMHVHGAEFLGPDRAYELDPLQVIVDVSGLGCTGYHAADWLRETHAVNLHLSDHRRASVQLTFADDDTTVTALLDGMHDLAKHAPEWDDAVVEVPEPGQLMNEQACLPRDAYFGHVEQVPADRAVGRVSAEMLTPYPPGIPTILPGEQVTSPVVRYLRTGLAAGMVVPDAADPSLETLRVLV